MGWGVGRLRTWRDGGMRWNSQGDLTLCLERTGRGRSQFVVCFHILIIAICVEHHLIAKNLVITAEIYAVALAFWIGERELIEVEMIRPAQPILIFACWGQTVSEVRCRREFSPARVEIGSTRGCHHIAAQLEIVRTGIRA